MARRPPIPERWSSLMPEAGSPVKQNRVVSGASQLTTSSSVSDFLERKILELHEEKEYTENIRKRGLPALSEKTSREEFDKIEAEVEEVEAGIGTELECLKRQKRLIEDDLNDECKIDTDLSREDVETAYTETMMHRVMSASLARKKKNFDKSAFRKAVEQRYDAVSCFEGNPKDPCVWCPVTGWLTPSEARAAHIVPKSLDSVELLYLFGGRGESVLSDPRNGLILHKNIEIALDSGNIVIVPIPSVQKGPVDWKLVVTNAELLNQLVGAVITRAKLKWKDIDGTKLEFRNNKRPARRYLYFRYAMTYLWCKREGRTEDWMKNADTNGCMWATPGAYLRRSMLVTLAKLVSDTMLPEAFYGEYTFDETTSEDELPLEQVKEYTEVLARRVKQLRREKAGGTGESSRASELEEDDDE